MPIFEEVFGVLVDREPLIKSHRFLGMLRGLMASHRKDKRPDREDKREYCNTEREHINPLPFLRGCQDVVDGCKYVLFHGSLFQMLFAILA